MTYSIEQLRAIVDLAKRKHYDELEETWLELAEAPPEELRFYDSMARALLKNGANDRLTELFSLMASALVEKQRARDAVEIVRTAWRYAPDLAGLREPAVEALGAIYGERPNFKRFVAAAGLDMRNDLLGALQRFEELIYCDEGEVFEHKTFGIGIVEEIEPEQRRVSIRFTGKAPKPFTFDGVHDYLTKLERSGFRAERLRDSEALKRRAFELGAGFVHFVLLDYPEGLSQVDLKNLLLEDFMSREEWDQWWAANRKAIRRDPYVDWGGGSRGLMRLRSEPKTYYEVVVEEFHEADSSSRRLALIAEVTKHIQEEPAGEGFVQQLVGILKAEFDDLEEDNAPGRLERIYVAREVARAFDGIDLPESFDEKAIFAQTDDPAGLVLALSAHDLQCRAVETLTEVDPTRADALCAAMLPDASPRFSQWLVEKLIAVGRVGEAARAVEQVLRSPRRNPETFLVVARLFSANKFAALSLEIEAHEIVRQLAEVIKELQNQVDHGVANASTLRGQVVKFKNLLAEDHYEFVRHAVASLPLEEVRSLCRLFESHAAFPDHYLAPLIHAAQETRPDLREAAESARAGQIDEAVLYVTVESLRKRRADLQQLRSVEIPKNSREIGEAAALGDLSENAEYEAARHRQRILFDRAAQLQEEIERARVINPAWVRTDCVWVGTRVEARRLPTEEIETYTILGAWDSRPEENVLSYLTPAASQFLYKRVGERVVVERPNAAPTEYEILRIENALA